MIVTSRMSLRIEDSSMFTSALQLNCKTEDAVADSNGSAEVRNSFPRIFRKNAQPY